MSTQYKGSILSSTEQPTSGTVAQGIWNTSDAMQALQASSWPLRIISIEYLVLAGGGAGTAGNPGNIGNGGGGAGGILNSTVNIYYGISYTFTVGAGATGTAAGYGNVAANGSNSVISGTGLTTITALGGGSAKTYQAAAASSNSGGCGGGGSYNTISAGSGTVGPPIQGYAGGAGLVGGNYAGGGGGGTGAVGFSGSAGGQGGAGAAKSIMGTSIFYGGGGGAGTLGGAPAGGSGGGGTGGSAGAGTAGTANLGGGGGGAGGTTATGANGGSGVIIVAYLDTYPNALSVSAGLVVNGSAGNTTPDTASRAGYKIYRITAGTGSITWV